MADLIPEGEKREQVAENAKNSTTSVVEKIARVMASRRRHADNATVYIDGWAPAWKLFEAEAHAISKALAIPAQPSREAVARAIADGFFNGHEQYDQADEAQRDRYDRAADAVLSLFEKEG